MSKIPFRESTQPITSGYAEDEYWQLKNIVEILEENGFVIDFAVCDGDQLIRGAQPSPNGPNFYITDPKMTELRGLVAAATPIRRWPASKVISLTKEIGQSHVNAAKPAGAVPFLNKPITEATLTQALQGVYDIGKTNVILINYRLWKGQ